MSAVAKNKKIKIDPVETTKPVEADEKANETESEAPKFELGVKGDDFDIKYTRIASAKSHDADKLLQNLSRESKADKYNFLSFALPIVIIVIAALSFAFVSRGDIEELFVIKPSANTIIDGSYTNQLDEIYSETLPFKEMIQRLGAWLGFVEAPASESDKNIPEEEPVLPEEPVVTEPEVTEPVVTTTEPTTTTAPPTSEAPTTTSETEPTIPETYTLYASATVNIRLLPSTDSAILGYFVANDEVQVIELMSDGWAKIYFGGMQAYCFGEYLSETTVETTVRSQGSRTEATEETEEPEITLTPEEDEEVNVEDIVTDDEGDEPVQDDEATENEDNEEAAGEVIDDESIEVEWE